MDTPVLHILIDKDGIPRTINKQVKVKMIVQRHILANEALESIAEFYGITLADTYAAIAYYYDNKAEIDAAFERARVLMKENGIDGNELRAKIEARLAEKQSED